MISFDDMFDGCFIRHISGSLHGPYYYDNDCGHWKWGNYPPLHVAVLEYYEEVLSVQISKPKRRIKDGDIVKLRNGVVLGEVYKDGTLLAFKYSESLIEVWHLNGRKDNNEIRERDIVAVLDKNAGKFIEV